MTKVAELQGVQLDYWVAKAQGIIMPQLLDSYSPSSNWSDGGPIIEREGISVNQHNNIPDRPENRWISTKYQGGMQVGIPRPISAFGPTPLIAAMRCFLTGKYGDETPK